MGGPEFLLRALALRDIAREAARVEEALLGVPPDVRTDEYVANGTVLAAEARLVIVERFRGREPLQVSPIATASA